MGPTYINRLTYPYLFGVMTNWFQDRADYMNAVNTFMNATDYAANNHLFPQGCKKKWYIENASARPAHLQIFKCTVKCSGGTASGAYVTPTTTTMAAPDLTAFSEFTTPLFDQRMRDKTTVGKINAVNMAADTILASNSATGGVTVYPLAGVGTIWEQYAATTGARQTVSGGPPACTEKLSWIFPSMKKKLKVKQVFSKWLKPWDRQSWTEKESWPAMLTPQQLEDQAAPTYIKDQSHFYFVRGYSLPDFMYTGGGVGALTNVPNRRERPVQFVIQCTRTLGARQSGDHSPNYTVGPFMVAPMATGVSTGIVQQTSAGTNAALGGVEIGPGGTVFAPVWGDGYF